MKRMFIGVPIYSAKVLAIRETWIANEKLCTGEFKWVISENWHVTLIFLGNTPETIIPQLQELMEQFFAGIQAFTTHLSGIGVFPNPKNPKVLWLGIENLFALLPAQIGLVDALKQKGFLLDNKPLKPHLTLARIRNSAIHNKIDCLIDPYQNFDFGSVQINRVILYESISTPNGPVYKPLFVKELI